VTTEFTPDALDLVDEAADPVFRPEYVQLLKALDRLLTVGSYYQPGHERYQEVVRSCTEALLRALDGSALLRLEITHEGFHIEDESWPRDARESKRLHGLLEPLNIALVEIDADVEPGDLHQAFSALQTARNTVTSAHTYSEVEIDGLPESVRTTHSSLHVRTRKEKPKHAPLDPSLIAADMLAADPVSQEMEREFMSIVGGIMKTADPRRIKEFEEGEQDDDWLSPAVTESIARVLEQLGEGGEGVFNLDHLIANARAALEMTGDPELVEMVFQRLQKDVDKAGQGNSGKLVGLPRKGDRTKRTVKFTLTHEELGGLIDALPDPTETEVDHVGWAEGDTVGIMVQLLALDPADETVEGMQRSLRRILNKTQLAPDVREGVARALAGALSGEAPEAVTLAMDLIWAPLKAAHPDLMGDLWCELWPFLTPDGQENAWPYLVNDLLLGIHFSDRVAMAVLLDALSKVEALGKSPLIYKLEDLPALQAGAFDDAIFEAKPPLLYPVFKVLVGASISQEFGPQLHCRLLMDKPNDLSTLLLECVDGYQPINRGLYYLILDQGVSEAISTELADAAAPIIEDTLKDLHYDYLGEDWVPGAIAWLGKVGREASFETLNLIMTEKKWKIIPAWPRACRKTARQAAENLLVRLQGIGHAKHGEAFDVDEEVY